MPCCRFERIAADALKRRADMQNKHISRLNPYSSQNRRKTMFTLHDSIFTSSVLELPRVRHAFSTRLGGVSTDSATRSMNVAPGHGDTPEQIYENISILAGRVGVRAEDTVCTHQIHSSLVCYAGDGMRGRGVVSENPEECDGFYTDVPASRSWSVPPTVRRSCSADCAPTAPPPCARSMRDGAEAAPRSRGTAVPRSDASAWRRQTSSPRSDRAPTPELV